MSTTDPPSVSSALTELPPSNDPTALESLDKPGASTNASKRKREHGSPPGNIERRVRQPTPADIDSGSREGVSTGYLEVPQNASAPIYTTGDISVGASASASTRESSRPREEKQKEGTSDEAADGGGSVLFSDQQSVSGETGHVTSKTSVIDDDAGGGSETLVGGVQTRYGKTALGDDETLLKQADEVATEVLDESQDQNDLVGEDDEDIGGMNVKPPAWLTEVEESAAGPSRPRTRMETKQETVQVKSRYGALEVESKESSDPLAMSIPEDEIALARSTPIEDYFLKDEPSEDEPPSSPSSYHSGDSDEFEMDHRPILERTAIKAACNWLHTDLWMNRDEETGDLIYKAVDRLGEGTFSSVFLARDMFHTRYDNEYWTGIPPEFSEDDFEERSDVRVALKKILVTSSPARIENELGILESLRGTRNVSQLVTAFRQDDQVIIVLPYHPSDDFRHFYRHMDIPHIRSYMRCLLRGLKDIHARGIIHRDVKPANFLFDYENSDGVLCDFGLAERYAPPRKPTCQHNPASVHSPSGGKTRTADTASVEQAVYDARKRAKLGEGRVGFLSDDKRPTIKTNRAGTRGFRAPEVLLKCPDQNFAIDIWSAGIILLSILAQKFPVFNSSDDVEALMELAALFGRSALERCAMLHNRTVISNVNSMDTDPHQTLSNVVLRLNPHLYTPSPTDRTPEEARAHIEGVDQALELLHGLLRMDCTSRYTAKRALQHPFFHPTYPDDTSDPYAEDLEADEVLGITEGKCGDLHAEVDGKHKAYFGDQLVDMQFGQGRPTSRDALCPEHEHWQLRTGSNALSTCLKFERDEEGQTEAPVVGVGPESEVEERPSKRRALAEKSENLPSVSVSVNGARDKVRQLAQHAQHA